MILPLAAVEVPLVADEQGGLRVRGTRVLLERVVRAFENGATPEGIVQCYDTLQLADVYSVLSWYLQRREEVHEYLRRRNLDAANIRSTIEAQLPDQSALREKLLARRNAPQHDLAGSIDAPPAK
ncbi:hypothetical protein ETAA8_30100 [Anatilimnocola aggregata]|uniref:DUF433 domain-containing protein n=1 Tax=Anatilimnocola aggregata TaxID=2528021 RepID=A0A517YCJ8_9BACT|nr:DUF433 domain-containing protein [Anatilimnocola aggregata]QDU27919.1 hypothetical protein ETAA8_30100 [Anatilimnocola aggregata]